MNRKQVNFKESDIPYSELQKIGITKMDILTMGKNNLEAFLTGKRTSMLPIKGTYANGETFAFQAKISLYRKEDKTVGVNIHPFRNEIKNDINLKQVELDILQKGGLIAKTINKEKFLVQLDTETNELLKAKVKDISIPSYIKDIELTSENKDLLKAGQNITLKSNNETLYIGLDLNSPKGVKISDTSFDLEQKIAYDRHNPQVIGTIATDKNIGEYLEYKQKHSAKIDKNENGIKI